MRILSGFPSRVGWVGSAALVSWLALSTFHGASVSAQEAARPAAAPPETEELEPAPAKVDVQPLAQDEQIERRLQSVLEATGWFANPEVRVENGVVFLNGHAESEALRKWAGDLARNTQDVAAVANRIELTQPVWDFGGAFAGLEGLWREIISALPVLLFAIVILVLFALCGWASSRFARQMLRTRVQARILRGLLARAAGFIVFLAGVYIVLRVSGLTQLALTLVGGTGLIGLALGIAFRDITENYLASIFLSIQRPFETGDLVEIEGVIGYVRQLNVRTTVLATLDGNLSQLPNARVYKSTILNYTTNPNRRENFTIGIGYDDRIDRAQEIALGVLADHPAVLKDPEPWILVDSLAPATVTLRVYFWLNGREHSWLKVRSSVIRLIKRAFQQHGISMPDEAREIVFPRAVPVRMLAPQRDAEPAPVSPRVGAAAPEALVVEPGAPPESAAGEVEDAATRAEGGLSSEAAMLEAQVWQSKQLQENEDLLHGKNSR